MKQSDMSKEKEKPRMKNSTDIAPRKPTTASKWLMSVHIDIDDEAQHKSTIKRWRWRTTTD